MLPHGNAELNHVSGINEINSCKSVLGECISKDSENDCLCAQMTTEVNELYNLTPVLNDSSKMNTDSNDFENQLNCDECECAFSCKVKNSNMKDACLKHVSLSDAMPNIQYANGTVKLIDTFDYELSVISNVENDKRLNETGPYVLKSCEAALGKCIVSGNGMVGEGCLCAKMMIDEQVTAEEIDDITPQPNVNCSGYL